MAEALHLASGHFPCLDIPFEIYRYEQVASGPDLIHNAYYIMHMQHYANVNMTSSVKPIYVQAVPRFVSVI